MMTERRERYEWMIDRMRWRFANGCPVQHDIRFADRSQQSVRYAASLKLWVYLERNK